MDNQQTLLSHIRVCAFVLNEAALFLDTHPKDQKALDYQKKYAALMKTLTQQYEENYGPLTALNGAGEDQWNWVDDPWPWENSLTLQNGAVQNKSAKVMAGEMSDTLLNGLASMANNDTSMTSAAQKNMKNNG